MCIIELGRGKRLGGYRPIGFVISPEKSNLCGGESFFFCAIIFLSMLRSSDCIHSSLLAFFFPFESGDFSVTETP